MVKGETKSLMEVCSAIVASLCYCYFVCSRIPKGKYRLMSLLPVLTLFTLIPLRLNYAISVGLATILITWLANSKLLLFAFGLGPLSSPNISLPLFIILACLPVTLTKHNHTLLRRQSNYSPLNLPVESILFWVLVGLIDKYRDALHHHPLLLHSLYCPLIFLSLDILISASNAVVTAISGQFELEPPSDEPYFATSLQDFWGKRWNLVVSNILRQTVYWPVRLAAEPVIGKRLAAIVGVFMTFVVSGLMHELALYYVTMERPSWELTGFFVLHGLCEVVEFFVKRAAARRQWRLHWAVSGPFTVGFVVVTGFWLFFPPLMRTGADVKVLEEFKLFANFFKGSIESLVTK